VIRCFDDSHNHNYTTLPNYHTKVDLGVVAMVVVSFLRLYFVRSYYVAPGEEDL
jgi:hypothetical protein